MLLNRFVKPTLFVLICHAFFLSPLMALESDKDQPIKIEADHSTFDEPNGIQTLTGNVRITQGSLNIRADKIVLQLQKGVLQRMSGTGTPVTFQQLNVQQQMVFGESNTIEYSAEETLLTLTGNAKLTQPNQQLSGQIITYNTDTQVVSARKGPADSQPVQIIIQPQRPSAEE